MDREIESVKREYEEKIMKKRKLKEEKEKEVEESKDKQKEEKAKANREIDDDAVAEKDKNEKVGPPAGDLPRRALPEHTLISLHLDHQYRQEADACTGQREASHLCLTKVALPSLSAALESSADKIITVGCFSKSASTEYGT